ncbi:PD-(D/E)XK nuclease family protein [Amycolatopsis sp. GA6-003]|uniref:PD-(D/E)XK nuclease family protein n=1 Tax=Amycolatopsis sp. GA6-003 TaxID=2652444 RepID=UPI003917621D
MTSSTEKQTPGNTRTLVRIHSWEVHAIEHRCPVRISKGAARAAASPSAMSSVKAVLDLVEFDRLPLADAMQRWKRRAEPSPELARWAAHAVDQALSAMASLAAISSAEADVLVPVSREWARQRRSADGSVYEETVTGRRYEGAGIRELRILRPKVCKRSEARERSEAEGEAPDPEIAFAAGVLAGASEVLSNRWDAQRPYALSRFTAPIRIRIVEISCEDGGFHILFDGSREEALHLYRTGAANEVAALAAGEVYRPGSDCTKCSLLGACSAVPVVPGILGVSATPGRTPRQWSVTDGREHAKCPARTLFNRLRFPRDQAAEDSDEVRRGRDVHKWFETQHERVPRRKCRSGEVPDSPGQWAAEWAGTDGFQARLAIQMIGDHAVVCPMAGLPSDADVHSEQIVAVSDPEADALIVAKVDLLYHDGMGWTLRETKTSRSPHQGDLFGKHPQLALAVCLSAAGVLSDAGVRLRVELEELTGRGPVLTELDATSPVVLAAARAELAKLATPMFDGSDLHARPGSACGDCGFVRWCPSARKGPA